MLSLHRLNLLWSPSKPWMTPTLVNRILLYLVQKPTNLGKIKPLPDSSNYVYLYVKCQFYMEIISKL